MINNQGKRLAALRNRVPNLVFLGLFGIAAVAGGFAGYASGLDAKRTRLPVYIMAVLDVRDSLTMSAMCTFRKNIYTLSG
jgi:hypothetical protein